MKNGPPTSVPPREANIQVQQTCAATSDSVVLATGDPADRAHGMRDGAGLLVPAALGKRPNPAVINAAKWRAYPRSHVDGAGRGIDSQFDQLYEAQRRLAGIPGLGLDYQVDEAVERRWQLAVVLDREANRRKRPLTWEN